jgi:hypothetical protein
MEESENAEKASIAVLADGGMEVSQFQRQQKRPESLFSFAKAPYLEYTVKYINAFILLFVLSAFVQCI